MAGRIRPGLLCLVAAGICWGAGGASGRMLGSVTGMTSVQVAACRTLAGGAVLLLAGLAAGRRLPADRPGWMRLLITAVLVAAFQVCYFAAVASGPLSLATLVTIGASPALIVAAEAVTGRSPVSRGSVGVLALALAGLVLLVGVPAGTASGSLLGATLLSLAASAAFAAMVLINASPRAGSDPVAATGGAFLVAGVLLGAVALGTQGGARVTWSLPGVGWLLVLGVVATAVPYGLYFTGLLSEPASVAGMVALLEPLTGTLVAVLAFGERLGWTGWLGAALLCAGVGAAGRARVAETSSAATTDSADTAGRRRGAHPAGG